MPGLALW
ncbi:rCG51496 [Rattus norvegicus]|nr:rCG51496 [Rattus norvegicus]